MARKICLFLLIFVVFFTVACMPTGGGEKYVVKIVYDDGSNEISGTGCVLDGGYILTAAHIFSSSSSNGSYCSIIASDGSEYETEIICLDINCDLALLRSPKKGGMSLASSDPENGSRAYIWSSSGEISSTVTQTQKCIATDKPSVLIKLDTYLPKGMSGAPITDKSGTVTGIVCARSINGDCSYAIPATVASDFLNRAICCENGEGII